MSGARFGTGMIALVTVAVFCWALQVHQTQGGQGGGGGQCGGAQGGGAQGGGGYVKAPPAKVTLVRLVDSEGNVDCQTFKNAEAVERKQKALTEAYEKAIAWRQKTDASFAAQGLKNEKVAPVPPIVDVLKKDVTPTDASAVIRDAKDWAVYEIGVTGRAKCLVAYAHNDAFAKAAAEAEFARAYNLWVKAGKKDGQEPQPFSANKVSEALKKAKADKALTARITMARPAAKPASGG